MNSGAFRAEALVCFGLVLASFKQLEFQTRPPTTSSCQSPPRINHSHITTPIESAPFPPTQTTDSSTRGAWGSARVLNAQALRGQLYERPGPAPRLPPRFKKRWPFLEMVTTSPPTGRGRFHPDQSSFGFECLQTGLRLPLLCGLVEQV